MSGLLRALRKRLKANPAPAKRNGKFYPGTIESVSIGGHVFPVLESTIEERRVTVFKGSSVGWTTGELDRLVRSKG